MTKKNKNIAIIDYGVGNLHSLIKAFNNFGQNAFITEEMNDIKSADAIVLPGVGAFKSGMKGLIVRGLVNTVKDFSKTGKPILGICLGAQLLMSKGYEFGAFDGLDIISGEVSVFKKIKDKIPHIGWNEVYQKKLKVESVKLKVKNTKWKGTILNSIRENSDLYFVHSYLLKPKNKKNILSLTKYGGLEFCSAIYKDNIYGCQFHPEKSGETGLKIIKNFINLI